MKEYNNETLAYRTDGDFFDQLIDSFGRRGSMDVVQQTFTSGSAFPGTVLAAKQLGFKSEDEAELLEAGSEYYLHEERRPELLLRLSQNINYPCVSKASSHSRQSCSKQRIGIFLEWP